VPGRQKTFHDVHDDTSRYSPGKVYLLANPVIGR